MTFMSADVLAAAFAGDSAMGVVAERAGGAEFDSRAAPANRSWRDCHSTKPP